MDTEAKIKPLSYYEYQKLIKNLKPNDYKQSKDKEIIKIEQKLEKALGDKNPIEEALKLYGLKGKVKVKYAIMPGNKTGLISKDGKTIYLDPRQKKGTMFYTMFHELEHITHKDYEKKLSNKLPFIHETIESKRYYDASRRSREWYEKQVKKNIWGKNKIHLREVAI